MNYYIANAQEQEVTTFVILILILNLNNEHARKQCTREHVYVNCLSWPTDLMKWTAVCEIY